MAHILPTSLALTLGLCASVLHADWPQWRGPARDGVSSDTTPIEGKLPASGLRKVWESEFIPSDHYGGHGSPVVSANQVILSVVWHERVESPQREIDSEVMQQLNYRGTTPELRAKLEQTRANLPKLRGAKFDEWILQWRKDNLTPKEDVSLGKWVESRFKAGATALPLEELAKVAARENKPFESPQALQAWMEAEKFSAPVREKLVSAIPNTIKQASDVVLCLRADDGKTQWRFKAPGKPSGRSSSSTAAVLDGRIYAALSTHLYCLKQEDGSLIWKAPLPSAGPAASPLVVENKVILSAGQLCAWDAATGKLLWQQAKARGNTGSPTWWQPKPDQGLLVAVGSSQLYGIKPDNGEILWEIPGGGQSSPVAQDQWLVTYSGTQDVGLRAYQWQDKGAPKAAWSHFWVTMRYSGSPILHEGHVYLMCGGKHQCVELQSGKVRWLENEVQSTITSPLLADGKLMVYENNGSHLRMVSAKPEGYELLGRGKIEAMGCTSPALSNGRLMVRQRDKLVCFDLRPQQ